MCFTYHLVLIHMSYSNVQTGKQKQNKTWKPVYQPSHGEGKLLISCHIFIFQISHEYGFTHRFLILELLIPKTWNVCSIKIKLIALLVK